MIGRFRGEGRISAICLSRAATGEPSPLGDPRPSQSLPGLSSVGLAYGLFFLQSIASQSVLEDMPSTGRGFVVLRSARDTLAERKLIMAKKKGAKRSSAKKRSSTGSKSRTKSEILRELAEQTGQSRAQVVSVFDEMSKLIKADLSNKGPGVFVVPGLLKIKVVRKPATKARRGINPFSGEEMMFKAKPARNVVKCLALKGLKDLVPKR
jgi:nucleoid DNA-binding protein